MNIHPITKEIFFNVTQRNQNMLSYFQKKSLLAYSGGKDSTLLLQYYLFLSLEFGFPKPALFHLQHCIRDNETQEKEIYNHMKSLELEFYFYKKNIPKLSKKIGKTLEETGRFVRYELLKKIAKKENFLVVTGHHALDYFESILINFIRGAGSSSLQTLPILSQNLFRPLLLFEYSEIQKIFSVETWRIFEDESNENEVYLRNRIRKGIVPLFLREGLNPSKLYKNFHEETYSLNDFSESKNLEYVKIYLNNFLNLSQLKQILDSYLKLLSLHPINWKTLSEINRQMKDHSVVYVESKEAIFWKSKKSTLYIIPKKSRALKKPIVYKNQIHWNGKIYPIEDETLCESRIGKKIQMKYGKKEVSEIFREKNIPTPIRANLPILEKNGFIAKVLFSMWDEELKDLYAYEQEFQN